MARVLLRVHNADAAAMLADGRPVLHVAARAGHVDMARLLIDAGAGALIPPSNPDPDPDRHRALTLALYLTLRINPTMTFTDPTSQPQPQPLP